ncbi:MAG: hypothetical protein QE485_10715 [Acidovorax sp.]|uniref:hypothetical protein n=1 Tax=Acidovorax sp. TaxID=1872122 RepID=UPI002606552B|nr:hypothetical protein [Acidovorax sp.]MDH4417687.1 hypothetical protein [Acidovorax sp.]
MTAFWDFLFQLGGAAAIVAALSAWIGKLWADRILQRESSDHQRRLKELESNLRHQVDTQLAQVNFELSTLKEKTLKAHADKLNCYSFAIDGVAELLSKFSAFTNNMPGAKPFQEAFDEFDAKRIRAYGHMALVAPQSVMTAYDAVIEHFIQIRNGQTEADWKTGRDLVLAWINAARADIGVDPSVIRYEGDF